MTDQLSGTFNISVDVPGVGVLTGTITTPLTLTPAPNPPPPPPLPGSGTLIQDTFSVPQAAPLASPQPCDILGEMRLVDTTSKLSVDANGLEFAGGKSTPAYGDPGVWFEGAVANVPGRALRITAKWNGAGVGRFGFAYNETGASSTPSNVLASFGSYVGYGWYNIQAFNPSIGTTYTIWIVLRGGNYGTGMLIVQGGAYAQPTLFAVADIGPTGERVAGGSLYPMLTNCNANWTIRDVTVVDLGGAWASDSCLSIATACEVSPANGDVLTSNSDGFVSVMWSPLASEVLELSVRRVDDTSRWIVRCDQAAGTIKLLSVQNGIEQAPVISASRGWLTTRAWPYQVAVYLDGTTLRLVADGATVGLTSSAFNQTATGLKIAGSSHISYLTAWPKNVDPTPQTDTLPVPKSYFPYGDSVTLGQHDSGAVFPVIGQAGYPLYLSPQTNYAEWPYRIAVAGRTTAQAKAAVDAELAALVSGTPDYILYNLGANDTTIDATWSANTAYILDAMHARWPNAQIYVTRPWSTKQTMTFWNSVQAAQDALMTSRPWMLPGPDERVFLYNNDNGATMTVDGTHPNHAGYLAMTAAYRAVLGV